MKAEKFTESIRNQWEVFCDSSHDAWFWHTREWADYSKAMIPGSFKEDLSLVLFNSNRLVGILPAFLHQNEGRASVSLGQNPLPWPALEGSLNENERETALKVLFDDILQRASQLGAQRVEMMNSVLSQKFYGARGPVPNLPTRFGFSGSVSDTYIIDLTQQEEKLWTDIRKGHKSSIKTAQKRFSVKIWNGEISDDDFNLYQNLHSEAAGRVTRAAETFDRMKTWIRKKQGLLLGAEENGAWVGFSYFLLFQKGCFYASSCKKPGLSGSPSIGHLLIWKACQTLKEYGVERLEMGKQTYHLPFAENQDEKNINIDKFKRGFGGGAFPRYDSILILPEKS